MHGKLAVRAGLAGVGLALALAAPPASATTRFKTFETWGWKADLPDNMDQVGKARLDPKHPELAKWRYYSDNGSVRLNVTTKQNVKGTKFADIAKYAYLSFIQKKPKAMCLAREQKPCTEILRMRQIPGKGRQTAYFIARVKQIRNTKLHDFIYLRVVVRAKRALAYLSLGVADSRFAEFTDIAEKLIDTFNLADPASVKKAVAKQGGKVAIVKDLPEPAKAGGKK